MITSPGLAPFKEIFLWDTESKCGLDGEGKVGFRAEKDATGRSKTRSNLAKKGMNKTLISPLLWYFWAMYL